MRVPWFNTRTVRRLAGGWIAVVALASSVCGAAPAAPSRPVLEYNRDIRPILSDNCFLCHGPDQNTRKAKLRLDLREEALRRKAIVPGRPDESGLIERIFSDDPDDLMPPAESHKHLTVAQKETLRRWVAEGAQYQPHWAYVIPTRPAVPEVRNRSAVANPIDAFVLRPLEDRGVAPSRPADRRRLLRRVSLDLTGLPPTPREIAAFVADRSADAWERQVDRLLASPHYGERMAVPWLDTARFSDTVGYHGDQNQRIFPYRDYVIDAFNGNKRFDQFTIEQLAGDLLPEPTVEQRIATGFNRLNMMTREGGAQPKEYLAKYAADRVRTIGTTWLGSTMGCAECHDHKFDPFTMRDFYSMAAFFADIKQWGVYQDYKYTPNPELKDWSNDHPFPPELEVESAALQRRADRLRRDIRELFASVHQQAAASLLADQRHWEERIRTFLATTPDGWRPLVAKLPSAPLPGPAGTTNSAASAAKPDRNTNGPAGPLITAEPGQALHLALGGKQEEARIEFPLAAGPIAALRLDRLPRAREYASLRLSAVLRRGKDETKITFYRAEASHQDPRYSNGDELIGILDGWRPSTRHKDIAQTGVWLPAPPVPAQDGDVLVVTVRSSAPVTGRFSASPIAAPAPLGPDAFEELRAALAVTPAARTTADHAVLAGYHLLATQQDAAAFARFKQLQAALDECRNGRAQTLVTVSAKPLVTRILPRGNWQNESGDIVAPAPPHFLPGPRSRAARGSDGAAEATRLTRLDLARWLVARDNPLTARVFMNRLWKQFFGTGLSGVVDDVGAQGEWPSHPALLDWLAVEFMESGWDIKHMVRLIVLSRTYRQDSNLRRELLDLDPQNRWLTSQNPRRLDAEFVRDQALSVAGLLNLEIGGPSVRPYQPAGYYANLQFPDRDYVPHRDDRQYRRGVYMHWQRTFLHPMLANFDAPAREECTAQRVVSNTPQQALTLLNDPTFVEAARVFAATLLASGRTSDRARLAAAFEKALGRAPRAAETVSLTKLLATQRTHYAGAPDEVTALLRVGLAPVPAALDRVEVAAWTQVCRVVLNLHETVTRY